MAAIGLSLGLPFRGFALGKGGATAPSNDPADLSWTTGRRRFWWSIFDPAGMSVNADGSGGVPAIDDPVGALITGAGVSSYNLELAGTAGTRKSDGIRLPYSSLYLTNLPGGASNTGTTGLAVGFRGYVSSAGGTGNFTAVGEDSSPLTNAIFASGSGVIGVYPSGLGAQLTGQDFTATRSYLGVLIPEGGGLVTSRLYIDGVLEDEDTGLSGASFTRDLMHMLLAGAGRTWRVSSRFMGEQAFTSDDDIALIFRFLENGA